MPDGEFTEVEEYVAPLEEPPVEFVEDVDTKSIPVAVVRPPLPPPVYAPLALGRVVPKRPNLLQRIRRAFSW